MRRCGTFAGLALLLAGCGGHVESSTTTTSKPRADIGLYVPEAAENSPRDLPGGGGGFPDLNPAARRTQMTAAGASITMHDVDLHAAQPDVGPAELGQWAVIDGELCAGSDPINKTGHGFSLVDAARNEYKPADSQQFVPSIPGSGSLPPGECVRGLVAFDIPTDAHMVAVRWEYPGDGGPFRWAIPAG